MELKGRNATWLELAVAPLWRLGQARVRVHPLHGAGATCVGITVDERWLCANDGRLTVFGCGESASRFLELLRIDHMEEGESDHLPSHCGCEDVQCMRLGVAGLRVCDGAWHAPARPDGPVRIVIQSPPRRVSFRREFMR